MRLRQKLYRGTCEPCGLAAGERHLGAAIFADGDRCIDPERSSRIRSLNASFGIWLSPIWMIRTGPEPIEAFRAVRER
jgi:hypothetical protein